MAVLINKAMIEIPPKFAGMPPVNPESLAQMAKDREMGMEREWKGAQGMAEDVRYYGKWMRDEAEKRIGHLYPKVAVTAEMTTDRPDLEGYVGRELTVVAWLWARTVKSPNPAFRNVDVPLATTFMLSTKKGREVYVEPILESAGYRFEVRVGAPSDRATVSKGTKVSGANFRCLMSGIVVSGAYIKAEGVAKRIGSRLMAIVAAGDRRRVYLSSVEAHEKIANSAEPTWTPEGDVPARLTGGTCVPYGLASWRDLFTARQLIALTTFSDLLKIARGHAKTDRSKTDSTCVTPTTDTYSQAVGVYLAFAISKLADRGSTICTWFTERDSTRNTFSRQGIPMTWDYAELNTMLAGTGSFLGAVAWTAESIEGVGAASDRHMGVSYQADATTQRITENKCVSTDPPYYDNISYADLSDFFYVWLRRSVGESFPRIFSTLAVPKVEELVASAHRHNGRVRADVFFLEGMSLAMERLAEQAHRSFPITIYYAFKQSERRGDAGAIRTGWETFLGAVIRSGLAISGTWPIRSELSNRLIGRDANALASSIVLVCRKCPEDAPLATRRQFVDTLKSELPNALAYLQSGHIAPVDLAQAAIGPGMAVYTRYAKVVDATGNAVTVREALALINETLDEVLSAQEGDFDADTRWALAWFEQHGFEDGEYGVAETLSKAKNTTVRSLESIGVLQSKGGKVRLSTPLYLRPDWDPRTAGRVSAWLTLHHLIRVHDAGGEQAAAALVYKLGSVAETARELAYRLYAVAERTKRSREALWYNALVQSWPEIARLAADRGGEQAEIFAAHGPG